MFSFFLYVRGPTDQWVNRKWTSAVSLCSWEHDTSVGIFGKRFQPKQEQGLPSLIHCTSNLLSQWCWPRPLWVKVLSSGQGCCYWDEAKGPQVMRGEAHGGPEGWWWQQVWPPLTQLPGHSWTLSFSFQDLVFSLIPTISSSQFSFFCNERNLTAFPLLFSLYCITELFPSNSGEIA